MARVQKDLRDKFVLPLDNGKNVYIDFFSHDIDRNIYQVTHQMMRNVSKNSMAYL